MQWKIADSVKAQVPLIVQAAPLLFMSTRGLLVYKAALTVAILDTGGVKVSYFIN